MAAHLHLPAHHPAAILVPDRGSLHSNRSEPQRWPLQRLPDRISTRDRATLTTLRPECKTEVSLRTSASSVPSVPQFVGRDGGTGLSSQNSGSRGVVSSRPASGSR